jgi:hypothetical protein
MDDDVGLRNSPFSPFTENAGVSEILHSPYRGEEENGGSFRSGCIRSKEYTATRTEGAVIPDSSVLADLLIAAMRACAFHRDGEQARGEMVAACPETPTHLRRELRAHFDAVYPPGADAPDRLTSAERRAGDTGIAPTSNDAPARPAPQHTPIEEQ